MQPSFGSIVWNVLFEPLTEEIKKVILEDVTSVVAYDPRLQVDEVIIQQLDHGLQLQISLTYIPENTTETITMSFDRNSETLTTS
jgi:phage baseplate assembly protein W